MRFKRVFNKKIIHPANFYETWNVDGKIYGESFNKENFLPDSKFKIIILDKKFARKHVVLKPIHPLLRQEPETKIKLFIYFVQ